MSANSPHRYKCDKIRSSFAISDLEFSFRMKSLLLVFDCVTVLLHYKMKNSRVAPALEV